MDTHKLRKKKGFVTDCSNDFLVKPISETNNGDYIVAKVPPTINMRIVPEMVPEYSNDTCNVYFNGWANWARVTRSSDNRFYFAVSDHRGIGCNLNIYEYIPSRSLVHKVVDVKKLLGWNDETLTDGIIHGHMGIMPDGTLWAATHYGVYPDSSWWAGGYRGSWLLSYNIYTHDSKNWGVPLVGNMLPCFSVDIKRGKLVGTGPNGTILCWDCINKKVTYAGYPPHAWIWWRGAMLCDIISGKFWTTDISDGKHRLMSFDPEFNKFERYDISPPPNPFTKSVNCLHGYTDHSAVDGWYYCCSKSEDGPSGLSFFKFKPEGPNGPEIQPLGVIWNKVMDVLQIVVSPNSRYVYYYPRGYPSPLVQFDVITRKKKVICWLHDYYYNIRLSL